MPNAAEIAVSGASPGGLHDFVFVVHDMVAPGQAPLVANGKPQSGQVQKPSFGVVNKFAALVVR